MPILLFLTETGGGLHLSAESNSHTMCTVCILSGKLECDKHICIWWEKGSWTEALDYAMPSFARAKLGRFPASATDRRGDSTRCRFERREPQGRLSLRTITPPSNGNAIKPTRLFLPSLKPDTAAAVGIYYICEAMVYTEAHLLR